MGEIIKIEGAYPDFYLFVRMNLSSFDYENPRVWKIQMHFNNKDEMWMLLLEENGVKVKPEDIYYFKGPEKLYWRAKKIKEPLPEVY